MPKNKEEKLDFFWSVSLFLIIYLFSTWPSNRSCPPTISLECLEWPSSNSNRIKTLEKNKLLKCQKNIFLFYTIMRIVTSGYINCNLNIKDISIG